MSAGPCLRVPSTVSTTTTTEGGTGTVTQSLTQSQTQSAVSNLADLGTIVVGVDISGADNLDPCITEDADACWIPLHNAYQKPLQWQYPNFGSLVGDLFTSVSLGSDNLTYTLTGFNSKAKFANGDPITAGDVVYTMQRGLQVGATGLTGAYTALNNLSNPAKISSPDSDSMVFVIDSPTAPSLVEDLLAEIAYGVVNKKQLDANQKSISATGTETETSDQGSAWLNAGNSAGSGPFVITSWEKDTQIAMVANPNYAGNNPLNPNPVKLKKVIFHHVADAATELALLKSGEIDLMWNPTPPQVASAAVRRGIQRRDAPAVRHLWHIPEHRERSAKQQAGVAGHEVCDRLYLALEFGPPWFELAAPDDELPGRARIRLVDAVLLEPDHGQVAAFTGRLCQRRQHHPWPPGERPADTAGRAGDPVEHGTMRHQRDAAEHR